jgi:HlyD family secretion protein
VTEALPTSTLAGPARPSLVSLLWSRKWRLLAGLAICAGLAYAFLRWTWGPEVVVYPVQRGDLLRTVVATGHVETPYRVEVGSQITGTVRDVVVDEGQVVKAGQTLVILDETELSSAVVQARGAVEQAAARVRQMTELSLPSARETLEQARANLVNAQSAYERASQLAKSGFATQASLDTATRDFDVARTQVRAAELAVFTMSPGGSDFVMAQTQLTQAEATLATARARLGYATVLSPREGVLISRNVERGTVAQPGKALFVLAPVGDVQLVVGIDEKNLALLSVGQQALASADAYPDQRFAATLSYINPGIDISKASVQVKLTARDPPAYLRQDMTVSVDIEVDRRNATLIVPTRTIHDVATGSPWVLAVRDGRARVEPVTVGLRAGGQAEITKGLGAGDRLIPVASGVRAGQRIRAVAP